VQLLTHRAHASGAGPAAPDGGCAQCHGLAALPSVFCPARRAAATRMPLTGWHGCRFPLFRRHRTRNGAGKPDTASWHSCLAGRACSTRRLAVVVPLVYPRVLNRRHGPENTSTVRVVV